MKKIYLTLLIACFGFCSSAQQPRLNTFHFLIGSWEMKTQNGKIVERWTQSRDSLNATSYKFNANGDSVLTEAVVLKKINGEWHFCVTGYEKGNEGRTDFKLAKAIKGTLTFENKAHDFPQQIKYQNKGKDELLAWIEGNINGKRQKIEFAYRKVD